MFLHLLSNLILAQTAPADENNGATSPAAEVDQAATDTGTAALVDESGKNPADTAAELTSKVVDHLNLTLTQTTLTGWIILFAGIFGGLVGGKIVHSLLSRFGARLRERGWNARGSIFIYSAGPANLAIFTAGLFFGLKAIKLDDDVSLFATKMVGLLYVVALGWFLYNLVDIVELAIRKVTVDNTIIQLIRKALRIFLLVIFGLFVAQNFFGADITAWLAGLGLAGLAVSLAAQGPIKNLFGSVTVVLDRPFGLGDRIKFGGADGVVEAMGFRSTKLRTLDGHLVTIPNSKLIEDMVENITARPFLRRLTDVTVTYDTPAEKIEKAVQIIKDILAEPFMAETFDIEQFPPRVFFNKLNADSLNILVVYWYQLNVEGRDWWTYLAQCEQFNLQLFSAFNREGIDFAFPSQTLYLAGDSKRELSIRLTPENGHLLPTDGQARVRQ